MKLRPMEMILEVINKSAVQFLKITGSYPGILGYGGYGSPTQARILARVLMTRTGDQRNWLGEKRGWRQYFDAQVPSQPVLIKFGDEQIRTRSDRGGYVDVVLKGHGLDAGWHNAQIRPIEAQNRLGKPVAVPIRIIGDDEKIGIVSDVDDTIMVTMVPHIFRALKTVLIERGSQRQSVRGMPHFFHFLQQYAKEQQVSDRTTPQSSAVNGTSLPLPVVYLSTGAWNVAPALRRFIDRAGYPRGVLLLKPWGPSSKGVWLSGVRHKLDEFTELTAMVPQVKWILVGDNGQRDPTTYATIVNRYPDRAAAICIRTLSGTEHVLTHGTPRPLDEVVITPDCGEIPVVHGPTGQILRKEFRISTAHC